MYYPQRLGGAEKIDPAEAIQHAIKLAKESDAVIIVGGLTHEWESEGSDRPNLNLPGRQDELITKVSEANPKTVVVIQAVRSARTHALPGLLRAVRRVPPSVCHGSPPLQA
jgi:hypothetical protein